MSENTGYGYGTGNADDRANAALGHAEGLRVGIMAIMRAVAAGRTGKDLCAKVAADLEIEAQQTETIGNFMPGLQTQATVMELKYLASTFKSFSAHQDEAQ